MSQAPTRKKLFQIFASFVSWSVDFIHLVAMQPLYQFANISELCGGGNIEKKVQKCFELCCCFSTHCG